MGFRRRLADATRRSSLALLGSTVCCLIPASSLVAQLELVLPHPSARDSHAAYIEWLRGVEGRSFNRVLVAYDEAREQNPQNASIALERCKFIGSALYDPEEEINPKQGEHDTCLGELEQQFPSDPEITLYRLSLLWGEEGREFAAEVSAGVESGEWSRSEQARLAERGAWLAYWADDLEDAAGLASQAVELNPKSNVGTILGEYWREVGDEQKAFEAYTYDLDWAEAHELSPRLEPLVELGAFAEALRVIERLETAQLWVDPLLHARAQEGLGDVAAAREVYASALDQSWHRAEIRKRLFYLDLQHGNEDRAIISYRRMVKSDRSADPLARHRLTLAWRYPRAAWEPEDLAAVGALMAALLLGSMTPLLWILPIHYVGLLRGARDGDATETRWKLRHFWYVSAVLVVAQLVAAYVFSYASFAPFVRGTWDTGGVPPPDQVALAGGGVTALGLSALGVLLLIRRAELSEFVTCRWSWRRAAAIGLGSLFAVRLAAARR